MVEHIIRETTKEVMPDASLRYLSKYMRTDSQNLNDLVFRGENTTLADSVGYYHNLCLTNSNIVFNISQPLNTDSIISAVKRNLATRLDQSNVNHTFINSFINTKIPFDLRI